MAKWCSHQLFIFAQLVILYAAYTLFHSPIYSAQAPDYTHANAADPLPSSRLVNGQAYAYTSTQKHSQQLIVHGEAKQQRAQGRAAAPLRFPPRRTHEEDEEEEAHAEDAHVEEFRVEEAHMEEAHDDEGDETEAYERATHEEQAREEDHEEQANEYEAHDEEAQDDTHEETQKAQPRGRAQGADLSQSQPDDAKYLFGCMVWGRHNNQLLTLAKLYAIAHRTNRTLVMPDFVQNPYDSKHFDGNVARIMPAFLLYDALALAQGPVRVISQVPPAPLCLFD